MPETRSSSLIAAREPDQHQHQAWRRTGYMKSLGSLMHIRIQPLLASSLVVEASLSTLLVHPSTGSAGARSALHDILRCGITD